MYPYVLLLVTLYKRHLECEDAAMRGRLCAFYARGCIFSVGMDMSLYRNGTYILYMEMNMSLYPPIHICFLAYTLAHMYECVATRARNANTSAGGPKCSRGRHRCSGRRPSSSAVRFVEAAAASSSEMLSLPRTNISLSLLHAHSLPLFLFLLRFEEETASMNVCFSGVPVARVETDTHVCTDIEICITPHSGNDS